MYFEDIKLGTTVEIAPAVIEKEKMLAFARDYDNIPLHTDEEYAKSTPFGKLIAPGVMSFMSVWAKYLEVDFFGDELLAGKSTKIEWLKPVYADDVLTGRATVTNLFQINNPCPTTQSSKKCTPKNAGFSAFFLVFYCFPIFFNIILCVFGNNELFVKPLSMLLTPLNTSVILKYTITALWRKGMMQLTYRPMPPVRMVNT